MAIIISARVRRGVGAGGYRAIETPRPAAIRGMALVAFATPFAVGMLLYLRHHTA